MKNQLAMFSETNEFYQFKQVLFLVLASSVRAVGHTFKSGPPKDQSNPIWLDLIKWFLK
jgi:hypothetical protein